MGAPFLILLALGALTGIAAAVLVWRARKPAPPRGPCCTDAAEEAEAVARTTMRDILLRVRDAAGYLATRREWRYEMPWVLLLGEAGAGKRSLMASCSGTRPPTTNRQAELKATGTQWHFFDNGVVIAAATDDAKPAQWKRALRDLELLRPERALDGLVLAVSARSLLLGSGDDLAALATLAQRQLADVQEQFDFVLPVYVVVTQCDVVDGFGAYWSAQPDARRREMFGWSIPPRLVDDAPGRWADSAFDTMAEQLKALQLDAAAQRERISDADEFFLFPRHFQRLRGPLRDWLEAVFQASAWQAGFRFRGLYFTGSVAADGAHAEGPRADVAFVDDLVTGKVLAERNLAQPTSSGIWSRSRLIRSVQAAGLAVIAGAALCLWLSTIRLQNQIEVFNRSFALIHEKAATPVAGAGECAPQERVYELLAEMARLEGGTVYLAMPVSVLDSGARHRGARQLAHEAFDSVIVAALACRLREKSDELLRIRVDDAAGYEGTLATLERFLRELGQLEHNIANFQTIEVAADGEQAQAAELAALIELTEYAYGAPLPDAVRKQRGELAEALAEIEYNQPLKLAPDRQSMYLERASSLARQVSNAFAYKAKRGGTLLERLSRGDEPLLESAREFTTWLKWARSEWIGATVDDNPCKQIGSHLAALAGALPKEYQRPGAITGTDAKAPFNPAQCYSQAVAALTRMHVPPYGRLFTGPDPLKVTPGLAPELEGLIDLSSLEFAQLDELRPFTCQPSESGWRPASIAQADKYLRQYGEFARKRGLAAFDSGADRPLYDRLARRLLEGAINHTLREAQAPEADPPLFRVSLQATARSEQRLARASAQFDQTLEPLLSVLRMASQDGLAESAATIARCARDYSADSLGRVAALAAESRLYDPDRAAGSGRYTDLGSEAITVDYLDRQVARAQVLAAYAAPYVRFLQNTDPVDDTHLPNEQTAPYWNNTIGELNRWVQFRDAAGQVGQLRDLFLNQLAKFDTAGCAKLQGEHVPPVPGNDLFSRRRLYLEERLRGGCSGEREARAQKDWLDLSTRFNRELAGRYPFAGRNAQDAAPGTVKAFLADYAVLAPGLRQSLAALTGTRWDAARRFLAQLDAVAAFMGPNLGADGASQPLRLNVGFHARPSASPGSEQVVAWTMMAGGQSAGYPNRAPALDWQYGQPLELYLQWADRSLWRPAGDARQGDLQVEGATASFAAAGDWALLRLVDGHRPKAVAASDPLDRSRVLLEFAVPVLDSTSQPGKDARDTARLYLTLHLSGKDPRTQAPLPLVLPTFPRFAPD